MESSKKDKQTQTLNDILMGYVDASAIKIEDIKIFQKMHPGYYYGLYENGGLKFYGKASETEKGGVVDYLLTVYENQEGGFFQTDMWAQSHYTNGTMEDFSAWDDSSPQYPETMSSKEWLIKVIQLIK